jgi:hypothetical protein
MDKRSRITAIFLAILGLAQMAGDLTGLLPLRAVAAATGASPAPKVFSAVRGLETYSTRFFLESGGRRIELTPEVYARMRGPYNRRNVYGAALAYAPVLPAELRDPVLQYALCGEAPLLRELSRELGGEADASSGVVLVLEPLPGTTLGDLPTRFPVSCEPVRHR